MQHEDQGSNIFGAELKDDAFWEIYQSVTSGYHESNWEQIVRRLEFLRFMTKTNHLSPITSLHCSLKISELRANHGGVGSKLGAAAIAQSSREFLRHRNEPMLVRAFFSSEGVALHVAGLDHYALAVLKEGIAFSRSKGLITRDTRGLRSEYARVLGDLGHLDRAAKLLEGISRECLDTSSDRDILQSHIRLADVFLKKRLFTKAEYHLHKAHALLSRILPGLGTERYRLTILLNVTTLQYFSLFDNGIIAAESLLRDTLQNCKQHGYPRQYLKIAPLIQSF